MGSLLFTAKCFVLSCLLILTFQMKIGEQTLEDKVYSYVKSGRVSIWLHQVSDGAKLLVARAVNKQPQQESYGALPEEELTN